MNQGQTNGPGMAQEPCVCTQNPPTTIHPSIVEKSTLDPRTEVLTLAVLKAAEIWAKNLPPVMNKCIFVFGASLHADMFDFTDGAT